MTNDTPVYHAFAYNPQTVEHDIWRGIGTREAIAKRGLRGDGIVLWCPHEWLVDGWRDNGTQVSVNHRHPAAGG